MALVPPKGMSKEEVNYRQHEQCKTCMHFYQATSSCDIVDGNISAENVCDKWAIKPPSKPRDKDYYMTERSKMDSKMTEGGMKGMMNG